MTPDLKPAAHGLKRYFPAVERENGSLVYGVTGTDGKFIRSEGLALPVYLASEVDTLLSPPRAGMTEAALKAFEAHDKFCAALALTNSMLPIPLDASPAERTLYQERYRATENAKHELFVAAHTFAADPESRRLLMEPIQGPREWNATTINDAPDGFYQSYFHYWGNKLQSKAAILVFLKDERQPERYSFFGPHPQPPEKQA